MLKYFSSIWDYRAFLKSRKSSLDSSQHLRLSSKSFLSASHKLKKLDPSLVQDILLPLYSSTGRPAIDPAVFIRSFVLMQHLGYLSLHKWCDDLASDSLLQYLVGSFSPPSVASHYDFIVRLTGVDSHMNELFPKAHFKKIKDKKPKKGEKLINYSHSDTYYLLDKYKDGADCDRDRMMFTLQALFNALVVIPSIDSGFIDKNNLILSADGSSLHIHSSPFGHKVLDGDDSDNIYRFSAPDADIGWDSDLESFYLGYTFYNISYHNPLKNIDLPVFASIENASRHDALSCISAAAQFLDMNHDLHPKYFCHDSAADSLPVFQFFQHNNIIPVIDHNPRRDSSKEYVEKNHTNNDGIPVCMANRPMHFCGYDIQRCRKKYRCPLVMGDISSCPFVDQCSTSSYGRVSYINDGDSARNAGPLSYKSETWKKIYRNRTSTERINNRVLNHYHLHQMRIRNKDKHAFFTIFACINIHLDTWIKDSV